MTKSAKLICALSFAFLVLLGGCYLPGGPVPEGEHKPTPRDYSQKMVDAVVTMEEEVIAAPLPDEWGAPDICDEIHFLRFRPRDGSTLDPSNPHKVDVSRTEAMLVMLPGFLEGANGFEYLARQLVFLAKVENDANLEVWAVERRNNRLEDLSVLNYAEGQLLAGKMKVEEAAKLIVDYYYKKKPVNGKTFEGWYYNEDVPFLSEFGLKLDTEDVFKVIQTMVPDPQARKKKVFVGGHSMGGFMTSFFAGWDLDGNPATTEDAGYNNCAGLFGLDTLVTPSDILVKKFLGYIPDWSESGYQDILNGLREGLIPVIVNTPPFLDAEIMTLLEVTGAGAYFAPDKECTIMRDIPFSGNAELILKLMHSRDAQTFFEGVPNIRDFRYTYEALLGVCFDDSFAPISMIQTSMGFLQGGPVVNKEFPYPEFLDNVPLISQMLRGFIGKGPSYIANDAGPVGELGTGDLYSWANFDEVGDAADPKYQDKCGLVTYTTTENEVSDIHDVARALFKGPLNLVEWYFSTRLQLDFVAAIMSYGPKYGINFMHSDKVGDLPQILFLAEQGMMNDPMYDSVVPEGSKFIKGYNHMDVLMASANTSSRRPSEVVGPLIDFVLNNVGYTRSSTPLRRLGGSN